MSAKGGGDLIALFTRHRTAANLLMAFLIIVGALALAKMNTQFFPKFSIDWISISIEWPGASAEDVDSNIVAAIEPEVRFLDSVKRVSSQSVEGVGLIAIEFEAGSDLDTALAAVETAVAQVDTLPEDSEKPVITRIYSYESIGRLVVSGPYSEASLRAFAKDIREQLLARGVDKVDLFGSRREEIWVEMVAGQLRQLDLTLGDVAARIGESSLDVPSGTVPSGTEKQIRSLGLAKSVEEFGHIEVIARETGANVYLRDVARITDQFNEDDSIALRKGNPAVELHVRRALDSDALEQAALLDAFIEDLKPTLPPSLSVEHYDDVADIIDDRINLLLRNGGSGLILVVLVLFVFLSARVAFWIAVGIPVSLFATLGVMLLTGQSINMVSLFAIIMAIGIIVDDAIVVGEHAVTQRAKGLGPIDAAELGAKRMLAPVMAATLTTIAAFLPLFLISDVIGQIVRAIPLVIVAVLIASLVECFFILPGHLRGALKADPREENRFARWFNPRFEAFRDGAFQRAVRACINWRYLTLSIALGLLILVFGLMAGGRLSFVFFPSPESDSLFANVVFVEGTKRETTIAMVGELERALGEAEAELTDGEGGLVVMHIGQIGTPVGRSDAFFLGTGDHVGAVRVELQPSDQRAVRTQELVEAWRTKVRPMSGLETMTIVEQQGGPPGREVDIRVTSTELSGLKTAANEVRQLLARFPGVSDIEDDMPYGKQEAILTVTSRGRALGFNTESAARQVRGAFEGAIAKRFARGDEEVTVRVRLPREALTEADLRRSYLRSPAGVEVPLSEVVSFTEKTGFASIRREDGLRMISITAEIDESITTTDEVVSALQEGELRDIAQRHDVGILFRGKAEEQATTLADMQIGAIVGLLAIYLILAWVFASYVRPIFVMAVIPFGVVGAILGHLMLGFDLTILSMVALLGLSGIVVNDSIILVRAIQDRLTAGEVLFDALVGGACDRLRAVILTSVTTIFGLLPLLFETSLQAQFLKPMAVTIVFGLMGATLIVLIMVPTLLAIQGDIAALLGRKLSARTVVSEENQGAD
jgi:multidrug efflux pump subunit AcrB